MLDKTSTIKGVMSASRQEREQELLALMLEDPSAMRRHYEVVLGVECDPETTTIELIKAILAAEFPGESLAEDE